MSNLLRKDFHLAMHPTVIIMMALSAMVIIPNYPYSVIFFYTSLSLFFTCLNGRENNDIVYSLTLPVAKKDIVKSRIVFSVIVEMLQMILIIPFMFLSHRINPNGNQAGTDACLSLFAIGFIMYGLFNFVFFTKYYKNVKKVGISFVLGSIVMFICVAVEVASTYAIPFVKTNLDNFNPAYLTSRIIFVAIAVVIYIILTLVSCKISIKEFETQDL